MEKILEITLCFRNIQAFVKKTSASSGIQTQLNLKQQNT
jgi:hypothetical protein